MSQEYDDRQIESVAQVNEVRVLLCRPAVHRTCKSHRVAADDAHAVTVEAGEAGYYRACPMAAHLEELSIVHDQPNQLARVIAAATVGRNDVSAVLRGDGQAGPPVFHARRDIVGSVSAGRI